MKFASFRHKARTIAYFPHNPNSNFHSRSPHFNKKKKKCLKKVTTRISLTFFCCTLQSQTFALGFYLIGNKPNLHSRKTLFNHRSYQYGNEVLGLSNLLLYDLEYFYTTPPPPSPPKKLIRFQEKIKKFSMTVYMLIKL